MIRSLRLARFLLALGLLTAAPAAAETPFRLMAFGDSLVHGYGLAEDDGFPAQLEAALEAEGLAVSVANSGNSGDTTAAALARLDWALAEPADAVIVVPGANDGLRGLEPAETRANLAALLERLAARDLPVLLAGMLAPRNLGPEYVAEFDAVYPALAAGHDVIFYPFFLEGVAWQPTLNQADGIHPNRDGVAEIVRRILPQVRELVARARDPAG
jgi:acyl-CoA thioesterase-1